jgi:hypothetical protein
MIPSASVVHSPRRDDKQSAGVGSIIVFVLVFSSELVFEPLPKAMIVDLLAIDNSLEYIYVLQGRDLRPKESLLAGLKA